MKQSKSICKQLIDGLEELKQSNLCHNDLKPDNIFYTTLQNYEYHNEKEYQVKIGDFGTAGRSGGTPGWTWPKFMSERKAGKSDMYSVALLILYVMCDNRDLFYRLRDNYVVDEELWLTQFREEPLIELVLDMMNLNLSVQQCKKRWAELSEYIENPVDESFLVMECGIPRRWLEVQDSMDTKSFRLAKATLLDE